MDLPTAIKEYWAYVTTAAAGIWIVVKAALERRDKRRAEVEASRTARAALKLDLNRLAQEAVGDAVEILRAEVKRLSDELADVRAEMRHQQSEHIQMIAGKDAELAVARGQIRQLETKCDFYRRLLLDAEIPIPLTFDAQQVRADGNLKTMGAAE